jgi:hypothetical protein
VIQDALVYTTRTASKFVFLSVMDFLPSNPTYYALNATCSAPSLWFSSPAPPLSPCVELSHSLRRWTSLMDALIIAATTGVRFFPSPDTVLLRLSAGGVDVRLLISWWAHSDRTMIEYLDTIQLTAQRALKLTHQDCGNFSIGIFQASSTARMR